MLLDQWGRPIRKGRLRKETSAPRRGGARSIVATRTIHRDVTPQRLGKILREAESPGYGAAQRYLELAELMEERDLHYLGELQTRKRQVSQIGVTIEPADDSQQALDDAELCQAFFRRQTITQELVDVLDAVGKGFSVCEIEWDMSESQWMPKRLIYRLSQWFDFDPDTGARVVMRDDTGGWVELDAYKYVIHIVQAKSGLPIRGGLARAAAWGWMGKRYGLQDWQRFAEAYGQPLRLGKYPVNSSEDDQDVLYEAVRDIAADAAAIIPDGMEIEFVGDDQGRGRSEIYRDLVRYIDQQVSIVVLGQTLTTQEGESGSYALGEVHNLVRQDIEKADADALAATLQRDVVIPTVCLNHGERDLYPRVMIQRETAVDLELMGGTLEKLIPYGLTVKVDEVRSRLGFEKPDENDEVLERREMPDMNPDEDPDDEEGNGRPPPGRSRAASRQRIAAANARNPLLMERDTAALVGPEIDEWAWTLRSYIGSASSLRDYGEWLASAGATVIDDRDAAEGLQLAMIAAHLRGRYDVDVEPVALAIDQGARLPFDRQIEFFRSKLNLPTHTWTDIWQSMHDLSFVVAGAAKADLVADLRTAVDAAIAEGETLESFRRRFDEIVAKHGWSYTGGRNWRTRVIYDTNLRTSYAAGRIEQMTAMSATHPYWRYRHSHISQEPRLNHLAWDKLVLRWDDPWWRTHYPPNGWGCRCYAEALDERDMQRLGKDGPDTAPALNEVEATVGRGDSRRAVRVPEGIDPGFAYAPGLDRLVRQAASR